MEKVRKIVDQIVSNNGLPCCKVCQCDDTKKIWCACHREQLWVFIQKALTSQREEVRSAIYKFGKGVVIQVWDGGQFCVYQMKNEEAGFTTDRDLIKALEKLSEVVEKQ